MSQDPFITRFMSYLSLFTFFMFILITADNLVQLFLGWEGVGLCSYLLINFWFTRLQANKAALKALVFNRIGDFGLLLGILFIFFLFRTFDLSIIFAMTPFFVNETLTLIFAFNALECICFFLFVGAIGKSAQIGLHAWLPDAMEGPTPVSALIHAATMVTAGVFLLIRCSFIFEYAPYTMSFIVIIGTLTTIFSSTVGLVQYDIKKVIAYSTCSQLGYMVSVCGTYNFNVGLFHLINHAFFKALLFLSAGALIHAMLGEQDLRKYGNLLYVLPFTYSMILVGSLSLAGFPFLSGFYSKDFILELMYSKYIFSSSFSYWLSSLSAGLTSFYSFRILYLTFFCDNKAPLYFLTGMHEVTKAIGLVLFLLALCSVFVGYIFKGIFVGQGTFFWKNAVSTNVFNSTFIDYEYIPQIFKIIPTLFCFIGIILPLGIDYFFLIFGFYSLNSKTIFFYRFLINRWYFDFLYNFYVGYPLMKFSYNKCYKLLDKGVIELYGPLGIFNILTAHSKIGVAIHTGSISTYASIFLTVLFYFFFWETI